MATLFDAARECLDAATVDGKIAMTRLHAARFARGALEVPGDAPGPAPIRMPGRPSRPRLVHPRDLPRRGFGSVAGRAAFIHSIAHIELNAGGRPRKRYAASQARSTALSSMWAMAWMKAARPFEYR